MPCGIYIAIPMWCTFFASGVTKKLEVAAKLKNCNGIREWIKSIINHLYWCAATSSSDKELTLEKWKSVVNHIQNVHEGHSESFPKCHHAALEPNQQKEWLKPCKLCK